MVHCTQGQRKAAERQALLLWRVAEGRPYCRGMAPPSQQIPRHAGLTAVVLHLQAADDGLLTGRGLLLIASLLWQYLQNLRKELSASSAPQSSAGSESRLNPGPTSRGLGRTPSGGKQGIDMRR